MERAEFTPEYIGILTGNKVDLLQWIHHGLHETPLDPIYPYWNAKELLVFAAASWYHRDSGVNFFGFGASLEDITEFFRNAYDSLIQEFDESGYDIPENMEEYDRNMNPFDADSLTRRLKKAYDHDPNLMIRVIERIKNPTETEYPLELDQDKERLTSEILDLLQDYPTTYEP